ncbi:MAG: glycine cleavage system protein R [Deltaproteobacteria bacterium]
MRKFYAVTAMGKDRPGIVAGVSKALFNLGANIEDSSMTILRSEFAMILIVSMEDGGADFEAEFRGLVASMGLFISVNALTQSEAEPERLAAATPYIISVIGTDKPGIVWRVAELLASKAVNITDLSAKVISGEDTLVYTMIIEANVPDDADISALEAELSSLEREMAIDVNIRKLEILEL